MSFLKHRSPRAVIGAVLLIGALAAGGAFAYFSTSGEGSGEAKVSNPSAKLAVEGTLVEGLAPEVSKPDKVKITNTAEGPEHISVLKVKITGNSKSGTGCETSWFKVSPETTSFGATGVELAAGASQEATVTVSMINTPETSQNACKGATVNLHYEAE
jgi:hypothetical protein